MPKLSKSKILQYERCPFSYKLFNIDNIKITTKNEAMQRGSEIHEIMDRAYGTEGKTIKDAIAEAAKHPKFKEHESIIVSNIEKDRDYTGTDDFIKPLFREIKIYDSEINISGIIDRVDFDGKNKIVYDYKTGQKHPIENYIFELSLYAFLFEKEYQQTITHIGIQFLDRTERVIVPLQREWIREAVEKVIYIRKLINEGCFEKKHGWWCRFCEGGMNGYCK